VVNKIDLAEAVEFNRESAIANIQQIASQAPIFEVSAKTGKGINSLYNYLLKIMKPIVPIRQTKNKIEVIS
jgi:hydrogenase nickel incorporation protein HypB